MRDFKGMKRQRSRNRGGGPGSGGGGGKPQHNVNRAFDSNGPDNVKIRGHAQHVFEKYQQLARDAFSGGDRVLAENYLQHADHYFRVLRTLQPQRPPSEILGRDVFASGLDIDFEDEGEGFDEGGEGGGDQGETGGGEPTRSEARYENARDDGGRNDGARNDSGRNEASRNDLPRNDGRREERYDNRRGAEDRFEPRREAQDSRGEFKREDRYEGRRDDRNEQPRREGQDVRRNEERTEPRREGRFDNRGDNRNDGRRFEGRPNRDGREDRRDYRGDEPRRQEGAAPDRNAEPSAEDDARPQTPRASDAVSAPADTNVLRSQDGEVSQAPAFLQSGSNDDAAEQRRPRTRRRRPRTLQGDESGGAGEADASEGGVNVPAKA